MHDNPGVVKFNVNSDSFNVDLQGALSEGYKLFAVAEGWVILTQGYQKS